MKGYTNVTAVENYTLQEIAVQFESQIETWIEAVENYIDRYTSRNFLADSEASEKYYDGNGLTEMLIDDFTALESITLDDVELTADQYYIYPANTERKYIIRLTDSYFTDGNQNVVVEANWGYSVAVPADIQLAATIFIAGIISYADETGKKKNSESLGAYSVSYQNEKGWQDFERAKTILDSYRKITF